MVILRISSTFKGNCKSKFLSSFQVFYSLPFTTTTPPHNSIDGLENKKNKVDFDFLFDSCTKPHLAKCLHALLLVCGKAQDTFLCTKLVNIYACLGDIFFSQLTFDQTPRKDTYTWNSMISGYVRNGFFLEAVNCFYQLVMAPTLRPDYYTFPPLLKACESLVDGKRIHCWVSKMGFELDVFVASSLVHMYSRFGFLDIARKIFDIMLVRDLGSWNSMISGFVQNGNASEAFIILNEMRLEGVKMDSVTISSVLPVCDLLTGMMIHLFVIKNGLEFDVFVSNALINMYAKVGNLGHSQKVFNHMVLRDLISWNSIIAAYEQNNDPVTALDLFIQMQSYRIQPDLLTLVSLSSTFAQSSDYRDSKSVHGYVIRRGWILKETIVGNSIMDMYAKLGIVDDARKVFDRIPLKDVVTWNTLITGYAQNGLASEAVEVYNSMMEESEKITPNQGTWVSILPAYSHLGALQQGMKVHGRTIRAGFDWDIFIGTSLIDMYAKCGRLHDAVSLFYQIPRISSVPWNALISSLGIHGHGEKAVELFGEMLDFEVKPDHVTFVSLLSACSHSGLVEEGQGYFRLMKDKYGIKPSLTHYGCMVDLLGRAGQIEKAYNFIKEMPINPDASVWGALLGACRIHGNVDLGNLASKNLFGVDSESVGYYVLLSNIYANVGKWHGVVKVRSLAREKGLRKTPGWSSIEVNNRVDVFYTGNQTHPLCEEIYSELRVLSAKMKSLGYIPDYSFVLQDVEDDEKENILMSHSERLAIAFGIISTPPKSSIHLFKNLRVCGDCHNATKYISMITERQIIVRDSNRFHHFKDGTCSCGDYWIGSFLGDEEMKSL